MNGGLVCLSGGDGVRDNFKTFKDEKWVGFLADPNLADLSKNLSEGAFGAEIY